MSDSPTLSSAPLAGSVTGSLRFTPSMSSAASNMKAGVKMNITDRPNPSISRPTMGGDSVAASMGVPFAVPVYLKNAEEAIAVEFTLTFDETQLEYADSFVVNQEIWEGGSTVVEVVPGDNTVKVAIYSITGATIQSSAAARWVAKVFLKTADGAEEGPNNPVSFVPDPIVATRSETYEVIQNPASYIDGNVQILGKFKKISFQVV